MTLDNYLQIFGFGVIGGFATNCVFSLLGFGLYKALHLLKD